MLARSVTAQYMAGCSGYCLGIKIANLGMGAQHVKRSGPEHGGPRKLLYTNARTSAMSVSTDNENMRRAGVVPDGPQHGGLRQLLLLGARPLRRGGRHRHRVWRRGHLLLPAVPAPGRRAPQAAGEATTGHCLIDTSQPILTSSIWSIGLLAQHILLVMS